MSARAEQPPGRGMVARAELHPAAAADGPAGESPRLGHGRSGPVEAVHDLSDAFAARDLEAALACFVPDGEIGYAGSERGETATSRAALAGLLGQVFARDEAYAWRPTSVTVHEYGSAAYVFAEADGVVHPDDGPAEHFPYRVSGLVERVAGRWRWRHCHGGEPAQ